MSQLSLVPGDSIGGRYVVQGVLGEGSSATAYRAHDELEGEPCALKLLKEDDSDALLQEFSRIVGFVHPHLVRVRDFGVERRGDSQLTFYTADLVEGQQFDVWAKGRELTEILGAFRNAVSALDFLHRLGVRHGDIKGQNLLVDADGSATLIDFSCAYELGGRSAGGISGTRGYLAPELLEGHAGDERSDLFSLGVMLSRVLDELLEPVPPAIADLVRRLTHADPKQRPASAAEVMEALGGDPVKPVLLEPPRLVGRKRELSAIRQAFDRLQEGITGPRVLVINGADGSGKSRLLREATWASQRFTETVCAAPKSGGLMLLRHLWGRRRGAAALRALRNELSQHRACLVCIVDDVDLMNPEDRVDLQSFADELEDSDPVLVVASRWATPPSGAACIELEALDRDGVLDWVRLCGANASPDVIHQQSGGYPSEIVAALAIDGQAGQVGGDVLAPARWQLLASLEPGQVRALAACVASSPRLEQGTWRALGVSMNDLASLVGLGLLRRDGLSFVLARPIEADALEAALARELLVELHGALLEVEQRLLQDATQKVEASEFAARAVLHAWRAGDLPRVQTLLDEYADLCRWSPESWRRTAEALSATSDPRQLSSVSDVLAEVGNPARAVEILGAVAEERHADHARRLAGYYLRAGDTEHALEQLELAKRRLAEHERSAQWEPARCLDERLQLGDIESRVHIKRGNYALALETADQGLSLLVEAGSEPQQASALLEDRGISLSYLGRVDEARSALARAQESAGDDPRTRVRLYSYQAINEFRAGNAPRACALYGQAAECVELHQLSDQRALVALNLGTAYHQQGAWGQALDHYERGVATAEALAQASTRLRLSADLGKLYADIGAFSRARRWLERASADATGQSQPFFLAVVESNLGELALAEGKLEEAAELGSRAAASFRDQGAEREWLECELVLALVEMARGDRAAASARLDRVAGSNAAPDVRCQLLLVGARTEPAPEAARVLLEEAKELAEKSGQNDVLAEVLKDLAQRWSDGGAQQLARDCSLAAQRLWERAALELPASMRDGFWSHPRRRDLERFSPVDVQATGVREAKLLRFLEINRRLNSVLDTSRVLELTMDAAIELAGAERGFLILRSGDRFEVPVARNLDRESVGKRHLKFSRSIAEQVILSEEPLLTLDAGRDERFRDNASVHAMKLRSVAVVPVRSEQGVLGALYLDNRFAQAGFRLDDLGLLTAFADQVGIALSNARLHAELERRTRELERERRRVEALARGQAEEIDRLHERVRSQQRALVLQHDYGHLVANSPAMRQVLARLDRVIESNVDVLVSGESGTGKELVARALHFNGPRSEGPFVGVNCAALPEALLESELFGHVRGAFTGASRDRRGLMEAASGGSLFLDELGEMSPAMQVKLLRALQSREIRRVGGQKSVPVDFRLISATNRSLREEVTAGRFREDLYYRVSVVEIHLPALRERREDLPELCTRLLEQAAERLGREPPRLERQALGRLANHEFAGNVRELENVLTKAMLLCESDTIGAGDLELGAPRLRSQARTRQQHERQEIERARRALSETGWNISAAARKLGVSRATLYRRLGDELGLRR